MKIPPPKKRLCVPEIRQVCNLRDTEARPVAYLRFCQAFDANTFPTFLIWLIYTVAVFSLWKKLLTYKLTSLVCV